jgi:CelD/BcsL family acetyltransferase involved in cellulose biosynthesis
LTWEWLYVWWKHLAEDRKISILTVRCDGELIAIAPLCLRPANARGLRPVPLLEFLGSGFVGSDYLDLIVRRGYEAQAHQVLAQHLADSGRMLRCASVVHGPSSVAEVAGRLSEQSWTVREAKTNICPYIPLQGKTWSGYLASLGAEHRYNFHRKWRNLHRDFCVRFDHARTEAECRESIDLCMEQHKSRWHGRASGSDAFHTEELVAFHRAFTQVAFQHGWLRLYVLRLNEKPAACLYGFVYDRKFYFYQSGFDPGFERYSVGTVSMGMAIRMAMEEGVAEYDLLHGAEAYKFHWARDSRDLVRWELYPAGAASWMLRSSTQLARTSRAIARRALSRIL